METQEAKITPQDIIDKEFRVKFRGFDIAEVDSFLEELAENLFQLSEENTVLHEKILALQQDLEAAGSQNHEAVPGELENTLEELREDLAGVRADLVSLKQDRSYYSKLENGLKAAIVAMQRTVGDMKSQGQAESPADFAGSLEKLKQDSEAITTELSGLKDDRQVLASLKNTLEEVVGSAREAAVSLQSTADDKTLDSFSREAGALKSELADLKQELGTISGIREDITRELKEMLISHFKTLEAKIAMVGERRGGAPPSRKEKLLTAEIVQQTEGEEEAAVQDYQDVLDYDDEGEGLEFLNEDDILDVDKLRNVFQSVLDDEIRDSTESREEDDSTADLLFIDDDLLEDVPDEPKVNFSTNDQESRNRE